MLSLTVVDTKILRVARLVRMVRILRVVKTLWIFQSLRLLVRSIEASLSCLFWSFCLLFCIQIAVGMTLNHLLRTALNDESLDPTLWTGLFAYFGTFTTTI